ncbi:MAG TPA: YraN family protein [Burkholderiaceae bacterium]
MARPRDNGADTATGEGGTARALTGRAGESLAQRHLEARGLRILARNYRVARGRSRPGGEIDLVALEPDGTLVFVEVRVRRGDMGGGAAASVGPAKQGRLVYAAQTWLARLPRVPPCRFDVVAVDGDRVQWLKAAFDAT